MTAAALLEAGDPRWDEALAGLRHDVYHRPGYVSLLAERAGAEAAAFLVEDGDDRLLVPVLMRPLPETMAEPGWMDAASPYGYPGPLFSPGTDEPRRAAIWGRMVEAAREARMVSLFLRSHPILTPVPGELPATTIVRHGRTVYVDLTEDPDVIRAQRRGDTVRHLKALDDEGYRAVVDGWDRYADFIRIYRETMRRVGADDYYMFDDAYFAGLRDALAGGLHLCIIEAPDGDAAAGGLFMEESGIVQYHLGATNGDHRRASPSKLMFDRMIEWARSRGGTHFHLGGGLGGEEDSLFHFKKGWSDHTRPFHTLRVVPDDARYQAAVAASGASGEDRTGFFPGYRRERA